MNKISILIPFHHEVSRIITTLTALEEYLLTTPHEIIAVYDDHHDPSLPAIINLQQRFTSIRLIQNTVGNGIKGALKTGIETSSGDYILFFVADDATAPQIFPQLLTCLQHGYDAINASRYCTGGNNEGGNAPTRFISWAGNKLFWHLSGYCISDLSCGIKAFRREFILTSPEILTTGWNAPMLLLKKAFQQRLRIIEIPLSSTNNIKPFSVKKTKEKLLAIFSSITN